MFPAVPDPATAVPYFDCKLENKKNSFTTTQELEDLDAMIELIAHIDLLRFVDKNSHGQVKRPRHIAELAYPHQQIALGAENLEIVEGCIHDPVVAFFINGDALGPDKFAGAVALLAKAADEFELGENT